jgi:hypothetical protein
VEKNYLKDIVVTLMVFIIIAFAIKTYSLYRQNDEVPYESRYKHIALSPELLAQIEDIEVSIQDRQQFVFTVESDPLEQDLIVRTQRDLEKQWREMVEQMVRLQSIIIPEVGNRIAAISYQGRINLYEVGDEFEFGTIAEIHNDYIVYEQNGARGELKVQKLPPRPSHPGDRESTITSQQDQRDLNW